MADLYALVHEDAGPVAAFTTIEEAASELRAVLRDEPTWITKDVDRAVHARGG